jgi:K+-sensing histidine kinase KdpD
MSGGTSRKVTDWSTRERGNLARLPRPQLVGPVRRFITSMLRLVRDLAASRAARSIAKYLLAVTVCGLSLLSAAALGPLADHAPFPLVLGAVMVSARFGGFGPSMVAAVLGGAGISYFFEVPANSIEIASFNSGIDLLVFIASALVISSLSCSLRNARQYARLQQSYAEAGRARAEVLSEATELLTQALGDPEQVLSQLADILARHLTWYFTIDLLEGSGLRRALIASSDPQEQEIVRLLEAYSPKPDSPHPAWETLRTGRAVVVPQVTDELLVAVAHDSGHLAAMRRSRIGSVVVVPLRASARLLGVITLVWPPESAHAEEEMMDLAQAVADRAAVVLEQARLQADLRQAVAARDALLASVAHDLRNPLGMIQWGAETARLSIPPLGGMEPERSAEVIATLIDVEQLTRRMDGYIQELVDADALQQTGGLTLHRTPTDLVWLVRTALESMAVQDCRLRLEVSVATLPVYVDKLRLLRVLDNLLVNALKYSPPDREVLVRLGHEDSPTGAWAMLTLQDQGIGIPVADLPHIFERFYRASNAREHIGGTGLGLWGAKRIVEQHGGTISLQTQEGAGTTVTVRLPSQTPGADPQRHPARAGSRRRTPRSVRAG